jgi:hypothetical protein
MKKRKQEALHMELWVDSYPFSIDNAEAGVNDCVRVPSIMYRSDPITCWNCEQREGSAGDILGEGCSPQAVVCVPG